MAGEDCEKEGGKNPCLVCKLTNAAERFLTKLFECLASCLYCQLVAMTQKSALLIMLCSTLERNVTNLGFRAATNRVVNGKYIPSKADR